MIRPPPGGPEEMPEYSMPSVSVDSIDTLLASYVAGTLPLPARLLVATHLELKPGSSRLVDGLEGLAGAALEDGDEIRLSRQDERLAAIFDSAPPDIPAARRLAADGVFPSVLRSFAGFGVDEVPWRTRLPGFREYEFGEIDGCHLSLFWIRPGRRIPSHTHEGIELSLVLDGAFTDIRGRFARGDVSIADESVDHRPVAEKDRPCIGMAVTDGPVRLTGSLGQRLADILFS